jgi:ATP-binding cassette subfamily F protein uup
MLVALRQVSLLLGHTVLLDRADFGIDRGERVCLVGRNGAGKSTLLRAITGELAPDSGEIERAPSLSIATLPQTVPRGDERSVYELVAEGLGEVGALIAEYQRLVHAEPHDMQRLGQVQQALEAKDGWSLDSRVMATITRLELDPETRFDALSGGLKRRALLARALVCEPDLLLLDEPTNHLDIDSIAWLEDFLLSWHGALLFVTHDRAFLRRMATRIVDLDRGRLTSWPGSYDAYLRGKQDLLHAEALANAQMDRKLAEEEVWIRKGVEARRTRNEGRVRALLALREAHGARRNLPGQARLVIDDAVRSGKLVVAAEDLSFAHGEQRIVSQFSTLIMRGDRIGIIGRNGAGKTTLMELLLGLRDPQGGSVRLGTKLEIAWFDQMREGLDPDLPVYQNIGDGRDYVEIGGGRRHVMSYLQDFLFTPDRARSPVRSLSGGERARLLLARLFSRPSNLIVLDEPTNDLDAETLELLEEQLSEYSGTVLIVSHDRAFLDNVVTRVMVFEGNGRIGDYVGGYADWQRRQVAAQKSSAGDKRAPEKRANEKPASRAQPLSAAERKDLRELPARIEKLEAEQAELGIALSDPGLHAADKQRAIDIQTRLSAIGVELEAAYARWEALEARGI